MSNLMIINSTPSTLSPEQLFRAACGVYEMILESFRVDLAHAAINRNDASKRIKELRDAEQAAVDALKKFVEDGPNAKVVKDYLGACDQFFKPWGSALVHEVDPLGPKTRREMKRRFEVWRSAEQAYARAGFRTISFEDWLAPIVQTDTVARSVVCSMMVVRDKDEAPVHHAVALLREHNKLRI